MYPQLPKSYKNTYPFRISTPSFIYPDDYIPNVQMLGPYLDEIELLCFESHESSLPSRKTIRELELLAREFKFTYNVHLPTDIGPGSPESQEKVRFVETLLRVMDRTLPLAPTTYTLHLPLNQAPIGRICDRAWRGRISESIRRLMGAGVQGPSLSVETLNYPLEWIESLKKTEALDVDFIIPGHGQLGNKTDLREFTQFIQGAIDTVRQAIDQGLSKEEAANKISFEDQRPARHAGAEQQRMNIMHLYEMLSR